MFRFTMPFEPMTINHLGLQLYSSLPPVISELVSNAFDAEAASVEVTVPTGAITRESEVIVHDWGHGMSAEELQNAYLPIGRNRRGKDSQNTKSKTGKRLVTGRKGLGKLSAFGVANEMEIRSVQNGNAICLRLNHEEMIEWAERHAPNRPYEPDVLGDKSGSTDDDDGVQVTLRDLKRRTGVLTDELRRGLARRLYVIKPGFEVTINGVAITARDRVRLSDCAQGFSWDLVDIPGNGRVNAGCKCKGWIGFTETSSQVGRGVNVIANGKAVELGSYFNYPSTHAQFARAHLVGEIHANFLDLKEDLVSTARNSVAWETEVGQALEAWGQKALKWSFEQWLELRRKDKTERVIKAANFDRWLATRAPREQKIATKMVGLLIDDPQIETESALPLLEIVKNSVESVFFQDLVTALEQQGADPATLLSLFSEWRLIEARTLLKLADGRVEAMEKLRDFIDRGALEVSEMQPLLEENLWLLNPKWAEADGQTTYTDWLRKNCTEPKDYKDEERRLDILGVSASGNVTVVEIKRPEKTLSKRDLHQIANYVDWARNQFEGGDGPHAPKYISGLLIVGNLSGQGDVQREMKRLAADGIYVETYRDLHTAAREYYGHAEKVLKHIAPEYARAKRRSEGSAVRPSKKKKVKHGSGSKARRKRN